jgi:alpha-galactosidase
MNTSPSKQTLDLEISDIFFDMGAAAQQAPWAFYDLWEKDNSGKWGKGVGTFTSSVEGVQVRPHATRVWKAFSQASKTKRDVGEL